MKEDGCKSVHIFNDKTTYGAGLGRNIELAAEAQNLKVEGNDGTDRNAPNYRSLAAKVKSDCFVGSGVTGENYVQVFKDVAAANPTVKLYGPDGVAEEAFTNPAKGGIPADVGARTKITVATLGLEEFKKRNNAGSREVLHGLQDDVRHGSAGPVRHLRLRDDVAGPGHASRPLATRPTTARRSVPSCSRTPRTASRPSACTPSTRTATRR